MRKSRRDCHSSKNNDIKYSLKIHYGSLYMDVESLDYET